MGLGAPLCGLRRRAGVGERALGAQVEEEHACGGGAVKRAIVVDILSCVLDASGVLRVVCSGRRCILADIQCFKSRLVFLLNGYALEFKLVERC